MDKTKIFINLTKCTEEEQKHVFTLLPDRQEHLQYRIDQYNTFLYLDNETGLWWVNGDTIPKNKTELTYPDFIKLFEGRESKEVLQVENTVFNIDFGGHVMAGLKIINGEIEVVGAINGYGNGISTDEIRITKYNL